MIEDKLNHDERVRLECVAQSIARNMGRNKSMKDMLKEADDIAHFILEGELPKSETP